MSELKTYVLCLDLKNDKAKIAQYLEHHKAENFWPAIGQSIKDAGIRSMDIYQTGNRLMMLITANASFSFEEKAKQDANNPDVQKWEALMEEYQQRLPWTAPTEKWQLMSKIFSLPE